MTRREVLLLRMAMTHLIANFDDFCDASQDDDDDVNAWIEKQKKATVDKQSRDKETALRRC